MTEIGQSGAITALTVQKRNRDRVSVFLDGQFAFGLDIETASQLQVGQHLSNRDVERLQLQSDYEYAKERAVQLVSRRPRSVAEVRRHLKRKDCSELAITKTIQKLESIGMLNDREFAEYWVEQREAFRPRSHLALRHELIEKGIDREIIDLVVDNVDETASARRVSVKKARQWARLTKDEFRIKLGNYLQRRGFGYGIIKQIVNEQWQSIETELDDEATN